MAHRITYLSKETKTIQRIKGLFIGLVFPLFLSAQCVHPDDYKALRALYLATNGSNWQTKAGWPNLQTFLANVNPPQNTNMSNWYGITCINGRITRINLPFNKLNGLIPTEFGGLLELTFLNLSENQLNGTIPSNFLNCINLQELNLEKNKLSGKIPKSINFFSKLTVLNLATNSINYSIPKNISKLSKLRSFDFKSNKIVGSIPEEIKSLPFLTSIDISNNRLSGKLPSFLALINNLQNLNLSQNQFSGCIDSLFKNLCARQVNFSNNSGLPWKGNFSIFCNTSGSALSQIGEPCGGCNNNFSSEIKPDCTCSYTSNRSIKGNVFLDSNNDGLVDIKEI
jgi:Leucine-rich repeat (LRR) protein